MFEDHSIVRLVAQRPIFDVGLKLWKDLPLRTKRPRVGGTSSSLASRQIN